MSKIGKKRAVAHQYATEAYTTLHRLAGSFKFAAFLFSTALFLQPQPVSLAASQLAPITPRFLTLTTKIASVLSVPRAVDNVAANI